MKMNFNTTKLNGLANVLAKDFQSLTQEDLIATRTFLENALSYENPSENKEEYDQVHKALRILLDATLFRPLDARSLPEFALSILLDFLEDDETEEDFVITSELADKAFEGYFSDGTMTYNTQKTLNYIRTFWNDFLEDDLENYKAEEIFDKPEEFLVNQTFLMSQRVIDVFVDFVGNENTYKKFKEVLGDNPEPFLSDNIY